MHLYAYILQKRNIALLYPYSLQKRCWKSRWGSQQHWLLVAVKMHPVSGCHQSPVCAGHTNSCSSDRQKLLRLSVWCVQEEALSHAGIQPQSLRLSQLPFWGSGAPAPQGPFEVLPAGSLWSMACTFWDKSLTQPLASRCKHWFSISLLFWFCLYVYCLSISLFSISLYFVLHS